MISVNRIDNNIDHVTFQGIEKLNAFISEEVRVELEKLFDAPNSRVVIDLSDVRYIDSSGFGTLLNTMKVARNNYGLLKICCLDPEVKALFLSLQLHTVFEMHDELGECIRSF